MDENKPREYLCISVTQFLQIVEDYWNELGWIFRGQDNIDWSLCPKAGREEFYVKATCVWEERGQTSSDLGRFDYWREQAVAYTDALPEDNFECLAYALVNQSSWERSVGPLPHRRHASLAH